MIPEELLNLLEAECRRSPAEYRRRHGEITSRFLQRLPICERISITWELLKNLTMHCWTVYSGFAETHPLVSLHELDIVEFADEQTKLLEELLNKAGSEFSGPPFTLTVVAELKRVSGALRSRVILVGDGKKGVEAMLGACAALRPLLYIESSDDVHGIEESVIRDLAGSLKHPILLKGDVDADLSSSIQNLRDHLQTWDV